MTATTKSFPYEDPENNFNTDVINNDNDDGNIPSNQTNYLENLEAEYNQYKYSEFEPINSNNHYNNNGSISNNIQNFSTNVEPHVSKLNDINYEKINNKKFQNTIIFNNNYNNQVIPEYNEALVTEKEYFNHSLKNYFTLKSVGDYIKSLFPIIHWLPHYNFVWLSQDLIAGITVGCVLVPQSMSYAQLATLPPQYGLYSSFIGAFIYSLFATSKDVCIGPVAVMSLETAKVIAKVSEKYPDGSIDAAVIASTLALLCGIISLGIGLLRLGFLVELISLNAVAGFMTGSALNIISGQVPSLMGYSKKVNTRESTYRVIIKSLKRLPDTKLDAIFGLIPMFILYFWKWWCNSMGLKLIDKYYSKNSKQYYFWKKFYFYAQACRSAFVIIVFTAISWRITHGKPSNDRPIQILGEVPSGLHNITTIKVPDGLMKNIAPELPASIIVLLLEHIAIAKSFGRVNDYKIVPDQELVAIGVTNLIGTVFHAYPATGSFSRSALKAKCNVKTPLSGIFSGTCVIIAIYCLTGAFCYIPKATLSGVIIHAVSDLVATYTTTWNFYKMNPTDFVCFLVTVFITVFSSIENGIYFAVCWSCAILLYKVAFPSGQFLGRVEIAEVINANIIPNDSVTISSDEISEEDEKQEDFNGTKKPRKFSKTKIYEKNSTSFSTGSMDNLFSKKIIYHTKWVPIDHKYTKELNGELQILPPPPGVIVYRLNDSYTYINCSKHYDTIFDKVKKVTRPGKLLHHKRKSDRPWNNPGEWEAPRFLSKLFKGNKNYTNDLENNSLQNSETKRDERPLLKIVCLDFSQVSQVDATAIQSLIDLRKAINTYADRQVEFHFTGIISPWIKRSLNKFGFGDVNETYSDESIISGHVSYHLAKVPNDLESGYEVRAATGTNLPFFHIDIPDFNKWVL
ncbi:sulfate permease PWA37_001359 [Arxiozyma heterogenica]|uniref:sulfate permease n=1 Tax=Arxiozyma heterogenica TaxID=278026 RepID=UPI002EDF588C